MFRLLGSILHGRNQSVHWTVQCLLGVLILAAHSLAIAGPTYIFSLGAYGDTALPVDVNDRGVLVWDGFGDSVLGGASRIAGLLEAVFEP